MAHGVRRSFVTLTAQVGLHFSVDTRIVEVPEGPSVLQVQVLYGDARDDMSRDTPGWHSLQPSAVHAGGRHLKLDVSALPLLNHPMDVIRCDLMPSSAMVTHEHIIAPHSKDRMHASGNAAVFQRSCLS